MKDYILIREYSDLMEHKKWAEQIPYISFPAEWKVKIIPPFGGAVIRFYVMQETAKVSAYLDCYDNIGYCGEPYWEIYPYKSDVFRCGMYETDKLLEAIKNSISDQLNQTNQ